MSRDRDLKFGTQMHSGNISNNRKENLENGRGTGHVTFGIFGMSKLLIKELKQEILNMRSLTNKTANIKYKNLSVYKTV